MNSIKKKWQSMPQTVKVSLAYTICSILQRCLSFFTLPLFTRLLTTEQYGQVTIYQSWQGVLSIFLTLNLAYGSFSTAMTKFEGDRDGYISAVEGICVALSGLFLLIYLPFRQHWNRLFELPTTIMCVMVVEVLSSTSLLLWNGKKRFEFKYISVVTVTLAISLLSPILQYILVMNYAERGYARILGGAAVTIAVGMFFFSLNMVRGKKPFDKAYWKYALGFNIPLLAYYLSQIVFNQSDRIMISHMMGKDKAAIYGVAYSLATVLTFVLNAINNSYVPWYYGKIKEGRMRENRSVSLGIAGIMSVLLLGVIWFAPEIISILAGEKYREAIYVVPPVAISLLLLFYSQLFINVEFYFEEKKQLVWASIGAALANLALNAIFIPIFGFVAAAYTTLFSYVIFAAANYGAMKQVLKRRGIQDDGFDYRGLMAILTIFVVAAYVGVFLCGAIIPRIAVMIAAMLVLLVNRNKIMRFIQMIRGK